MYQYKQVDFGFVVLCPERNMGGLKSTIRSIKNYFPDSHQLCIAPSDAIKEEIKEMKDICPTEKGGDTYTSLINKGMAKAKAPWNFLMFAGSYLRTRFYHKYAYFVEDEKDILFPIVDRHYCFVDGSLNGVLVHKAAFKEIGNMNEKFDIGEAKALWAAQGVEKGFRFKALMGAKII